MSQVKARPLAMGGAFMAVEDDWPTVGFNPATFSLYRASKKGRLTFLLNPVSPFVGASDNDKLFDGQGSTVDDYLLSLGLFLKAISFSTNAFDFGFLLAEQGLNSSGNFFTDKLFDVGGFRQNHSHQFIAHLKLADKVAVGGTASVVYRSKVDDPRERESGFGISYGILLKPEKGLKIGVSFINLADSVQQFRSPVERLVDESVNVGISYQPFNGTLFSLDVRNIGEEDSVAVRELHLGLEQIFFSHLAIRAGFFRQEEDSKVYSFGLGLVDENAFWGSENKFGHGNFLFNYAFVYEQRPLIDNRWHFVSFFFRL
ncbi:MAG: hypothetical protein ACE5G1_01665 [bacterium]